ncbi:MAG: NAD-binding protein [Phycisphaeraceae bacterium]|nr:NAD-binding protein [Phycisphaeraceae bacterium]
MATVVLVAFEALTRLFADSIQQALLRRKRGHIVICGLGATGLGLVRHLREPNGSTAGNPPRPYVVVIDANPSNEHIERCRELGAVVIHGDATDEKLLERVRAERAAQVYFVTGSDEANIEGACDLRQLVHALPTSEAARPQVSIHLRRPELALLLEPVARPASAHSQPLDVQCFNILEQAADDVVARVLMPLRPRTTDQVLHVVIVGVSPVAQRLAVRIADRAHFENCKRTRMTILVSPNDRAAVESFNGQYPRFFPNEIRDPWNPESAKDDWGFGVRNSKSDHPSERAQGVTFAVNGGFAEHTGGLSSPDVRSSIVALANAPGVVPVVVVCGDDDEEICTTAIDLQAELVARCTTAPQTGDSQRRVTVAAYVPSRPRLAELVRQSGVVVFGVPGGMCALTSLASSAQRPLAEQLAMQYLARTSKSQPVHAAESTRSNSTPEANTHFVNLPLWERRSNLAAAGHLPVKLAAVGLCVVRRGPTSETLDGFTLPPESRKLLAVMEHNRWLADRLVSGWQFGKRSDEYKLRSAIVDWSHLSQDEADKDYAQIDDLFRWLGNSTTFSLGPAAASKGSPPATAKMEAS